MKTLNIISTLFISVITGLLSMIFYIGSLESKQKLIQQLPFSFLMRFCAFTILGFILIGVLILFNLGINKLKKNEREKINLYQLAKFGFITTIIFCFIGTFIFFIF